MASPAALQPTFPDRLTVLIDLIYALRPSYRQNGMLRARSLVNLSSLEDVVWDSA